MLCVFVKWKYPYKLWTLQVNTYCCAPSPCTSCLKTELLCRVTFAFTSAVLCRFSASGIKNQRDKMAAETNFLRYPHVSARRNLLRFPCTLLIASFEFWKSLLTFTHTFTAPLHQHRGVVACPLSWGVQWWETSCVCWGQGAGALRKTGVLWHLVCRR